MTRNTTLPHNKSSFIESPADNQKKRTQSQEISKFKTGNSEAISKDAKQNEDEIKKYEPIESIRERKEFRKFSTDLDHLKLGLKRNSSCGKVADSSDPKPIKIAALKAPISKQNSTVLNESVDDPNFRTLLKETGTISARSSGATTSAISRHSKTSSQILIMTSI